MKICVAKPARVRLYRVGEDDFISALACLWVVNVVVQGINRLAS